MTDTASPHTASPAAASPDAAEDKDAPSLLVQEGDIAADYLERLLDIVDYDGDIDLDVENGRAMVAIVGSELQPLIGPAGATLDALQELTRLAVQQQTGVRSRLMLDVSGPPPGPPRGVDGTGEADRGGGAELGRAGPADPDEPVRAQGRPRRHLGDRRCHQRIRGRGAEPAGCGAAGDVTGSESAASTDEPSPAVPPAPPDIVFRALRSRRRVAGALCRWLAGPGTRAGPARATGGAAAVGTPPAELGGRSGVGPARRPAGRHRHWSRPARSGGGVRASRSQGRSGRIPAPAHRLPHRGGDRAGSVRSGSGDPWQGGGHCRAEHGRFSAVRDGTGGSAAGPTGPVELSATPSAVAACLPSREPAPRTN